MEVYYILCMVRTECFWGRLISLLHDEFLWIGNRCMEISTFLHAALLPRVSPFHLS